MSLVNALEVQSVLIEVFKEWGIPKSIRVDNGKPLGDPQRKSISRLGLWLEGMGIKAIFNRPRKPTDNATVERMQRTTKNWAEVEQCSNQEQLKKRLQQVANLQREHFKVKRWKGKTRKEVFPELWNNQRKYAPQEFDPKKAYQALAAWTFVRRCSKQGQFSLYAQVYYIGTKWAKQDMAIQFDPVLVVWKVKDEQGNIIKTFEAPNFERVHLWNLTVEEKVIQKAQT